MQDILILLRNQNNVTAKRMARMLDISEVQYRKKEKGLAPFKQEEMIIISKYFQKSLDYIFLPRKQQNVADNNLD